MYLKRLDIQGFKTFASRTRIEFRPGITAVVGPNGSGKSNIADAVRWVLGEQSLTNLRCKRSEELIYAGGGRRSGAGFAEVALTIDNSDRLLPLDFDEVMIARRITRAGDNEYFINRNRVRLRDVQAATEPLGGSYTIINQGLVDAALTLRPEDRRRLFEDAAEIGGFDLRKAEALRRLRETDTNLQRISDLLAELEPRIRSLKRQAGQARQYHDLRRELRTLQEEHFAALWHAAQTANSHARSDVDRSTQDLALVRTDHMALSDDVQRLRERLRSRRDELGLLHQQSSRLHQQAETLQRTLAVDAERLAALTRRADELARQRQDLALRQHEDVLRQSAAAAAVAQAEASLEAERAALRHAEATVAQAEEARQALTRALRRAQDNALRSATAVAEYASRIEQVRNQASRLSHDQTALATSVNETTSRLEAANAQVTHARQVLATAEAQHASAIEAEHAARSNRDALRAKRTTAEDERTAARRKLADLEARLESLSRLARSYTGTFAGVRAAMQWAEKVGRPGFALVQSIIRTPAELETAIEVALGSRLQNIVVEHWQDAEDAIANLKRSGAGRATFMPLDSIRRDVPARRTSPSGQRNGIASELVDYDEHYAPVVQQLLGRVRIVPDLATARSELRQLTGGWTIVTLQGEQVQSGGSVTGGAQTKESGTLRRERELRELPVQVAAARAAAEAADAQRSAVEAQIQLHAQTLRELDTHVRETGRQVESQRVGVDAATRQVAQAEQEHTWAIQRQARLSSDLANLQAQEVALTTQHRDATGAAAAAAAHLATLRTQQENETQRDRTIQTHVAELRASVGTTEGHLRAQHTLLATYERSVAEAEEQIVRITTNSTNLEAEREGISHNHEQATAEHQALLTAIDTLRSHIDPIEQALHTDEQALSAQEHREQTMTAALLEQEAAHQRAVVALQRSIDRQDAIYERAAGEEIDVEALTSVRADGAAANLPAEIDALRTKILRLGAVNQLALEEFEEASERHRFLSEQVADLRAAEASLLALISELESTMSQRFITTFNAIAVEFTQSFSQLFGGGSAKLQLTGQPEGNGAISGSEEGGAASNPHQGVEIIVRPPGKKQQNISLLSGGERTLTAAALLFAILKVNPSPFCILDETDAALDESNVGRFRSALQSLVNQTQFIVITHNRGTIEAADTLYGITMGDDGASKTISLQVT